MLGRTVGGKEGETHRSNLLLHFNSIPGPQPCGRGLVLSNGQATKRWYTQICTAGGLLARVGVGMPDMSDFYYSEPDFYYSDPDLYYSRRIALSALTFTFTSLVYTHFPQLTHRS